MYQLIIFGPPGVGKGTQAEIIASKLDLEHISTGAILRQAVSEGTDLGKKAKEIMDKGNLVPDEVMNGIVKETLSKISKSGFILDGFPRTVEQAQALSAIFDELNMNNVLVINLTAGENEIIDRLLKRGRSDDTRDTIMNRLKIYFESTKPVKDYYEKIGIVNDVEGVGEINDINEAILDKINKP
ncbi:MAG TPA: adenylate kinase [Ignavibacteria bacterium]|nr:adenylate kinase [Ignavibacteria bacterium]HMR39415.1 adenylate kinase [Ignavibacteria bacterium]